MKKIFRMALVFALAGATLMYTGCTKDYSEDINKLDSELSALENDLAGVKAELGTLQSAVNALESAYKAADKELEGKFNDKIAEINAALDKKADKKWAEDEMANLKKELLAKAEELEKTAEALKEEVKAKLDEFYAIISGELRSLVFVPDFYFAGIEATSYSVADFDAYVINALKGDNKFSAKKVTFNKGAKLGELPDGMTVTDPAGAPGAKAFESIVPATVKEKGKDVPYSYTKGANAVAYYDLNPSSFPVDSAKWSFNYMDRTIVNTVKGEEKRVWTPNVVSVEGVDGQVAVTYEIENPDLLIAATAFIDGVTIDEEAEEATALGNVPVIQLVAALDGDKTVSSDWEALVPDTDVLDHLAFTKESKYTTTIACGNDKIVLYPGAFQTLDNDPSIAWKYNAGPLDFAKVIKIHMTSSVTGEAAYTFEEFAAKYPGFTMTYEEVPYTIGDEKTSEDAYADLQGSVFTPCWVNEKGKSEVIAKDADYGISSVGRLPMFLVTLYEPNGNAVLHGYFKVEIAPEDVVYSIQEIDVKDFGKLPYLCATSQSTKWYEFSANVLEGLKVDYKQFIASYGIIENGKTEPTKIAQGNEYSAEIFVWDAEKEDYVIAYVPDEKTGKPTDVEVDFGTITYKVDSDGNGVNDKFTWAFDAAAAENINEFGDVYVLFMINEYTGAAFKFSAEIAEPAEITYGKINPVYWFKDVEADAQNTVRANVLVPQKTADDVTVFTKDLDDYFVGNQLKVQLKDAADPVYAKYFDGKDGDDMVTEYTYSFAAEQPVITFGKDVYTLCTNADGTVLYLAATNAKGELLPVQKDSPANLIDRSKNYLLGDAIASLAADGALTYYWAEGATKSKTLLNFWGKEETEVAKMLYANVQIDFTAGDGEECAAAEGSDVFHVRFIRPLTVNPTSAKGLRDAVPGGDVIFLGNLINATDWNDNEPDPIFKWHAMPTDPKAAETEKFEGFIADTYKAAAGNEIVWFNYYKLAKVKVDAANVMTDQDGEWAKLSAVNDAAKVYLATIEGTGDDAHFVEVASGEATFATATKDATTGYYLIPELMNYLLVYENNMGVVDDFNLKVPVTLTYAWGELSAEVIIPVDATYNKSAE